MEALASLALGPMEPVGAGDRVWIERRWVLHIERGDLRRTGPWRHLRDSSLAHLHHSRKV
jgi:hypothetical protein